MTWTVGNLREQLGRAVGRAVIDDQHVAGVTQDRGEDRLEVRLLVVDRNGGEQSHRRNLARNDRSTQIFAWL